MAKAKAKRKAPTRTCEKCGKAYHPRSKACPKCGAANPALGKSSKGKKPRKAAAAKKAARPAPAQASKSELAVAAQFVKECGSFDKAQGALVALSNLKATLDDVPF